MSWSSLHGKCYKLSDNTKPYQDAKDDCQANGGTLASVSSNEEKEHLLKLVDDVEMMIGAKDEEWDDGAYWDFAKYLTASDEEAGGAGSCVVLKGPGKVWRKVNCYEKYQYICQVYCEYGIAFYIH